MKNRVLSYANKKRTDQPAHSRFSNGLETVHDLSSFYLQHCLPCIWLNRSVLESPMRKTRTQIL